MKGDFHVRFCENAGVKLLCVTQLETEQPAPQLTAPAIQLGTDPIGVATTLPIIAPATPPSIPPFRSAFPRLPQLNFPVIEVFIFHLLWLLGILQ